MATTRTTLSGLVIDVLEFLPSVVLFILRALGPVMVAVAWCIFTALTYVYFMHIIPIYGISTFEWPANIVTAVGLWILFNLFYNHTMAIFTSPGDGQLVALDVPTDIEQRIAQDPSSGLFCERCVRPKIDRAHHCAICRTCVLKMDHHCPWVANCVGFHNYRYFFLFLLYLWLGCLFIMLTVLPLYRVEVEKELWWEHSAMCLIAGIISLGAMASVSCMAGFHLYLIVTNQTTIEMMDNGKRRRQDPSYENPYDLGVRRNFQSVFGVGRLYCSWLIPGGTLLHGDGIAFEKRKRRATAPNV